MLDPAITFARPHFVFLTLFLRMASPPSLDAVLGTHPGGAAPCRLSSFRKSPRPSRRPGRSSGKEQGRARLSCVGGLSSPSSHRTRWPTCHSWLQLRWRSARRCVPRHLYVHGRSRNTGPSYKRLARNRFDELVDNSQDLRSQRLAAICSKMMAAQDQIMRLGRTGAHERVATFLLGCRPANRCRCGSAGRD